MTEYLSNTSYWQTLESLPVKISSPYQHKDIIERTTSVKAVGDDRFKLCQFKFDFTKSNFPLEHGLIINEETGEYIGMLIFTPDPEDHHSIVLARPIRFRGSFSATLRVYGTNPFLEYEAWSSLPKELVTVTGLTKRKGANIELSYEARSYKLGCYKVFQFDEPIRIFRKKRLSFISGCTITDPTCFYRCLLIMTPNIPQIPIAITIKI